MYAWIYITSSQSFEPKKSLRGSDSHKYDLSAFLGFAILVEARV